MAFDYTRAQQTVDRQIKRFGKAAVLRRSGVDRPCHAALLDYNPHGKDLILEGARRALVSPLGLDVPPNHELDLLVFDGEVLRIVAPVKGPRPSGTAVYYDLMVVYQSTE